MTQFCTYLHCKPNGDPFYVGKGTVRRSAEMFKSRRNPHHVNIVNKYGVENIKIFVFPCESEEQAFADEIQQIAQLRADGHELVNMTDGGEGHSGKGHPAWNKGMKMLNPPWNKGLKTGKPAWNKGIRGDKSHSFGNKHTLGWKMPEEQKRQKSEAQKAYRASLTEKQNAELTRKISAANKGQVPWIKGRKQAPEHIAKRMLSRNRTMETKKHRS